jgi:hypothetical protein
MLALGKRVHPDLPELSYVEVATGPVVIQQMDAGGIDLAILDGEATPEGGMGIAKQLKDEIDHGPPIVVLTGRRDDAWLATWSRAEAAVPQPIDPIRLSRTGPGHRPVQPLGRAERRRRAEFVDGRNSHALLIIRDARMAGGTPHTSTCRPPDRLWLRSHLDC